MFEGFRGEKHHKNRKNKKLKRNLGSETTGYAGIDKTTAVVK